MFQAVAIGGAYATGREIIEFGGVYGAYGWAAGVGMALLGALLGFLVYETARRYQLFDYRAMMKHLIGRFSWLFDVIYIPFAVLIIAVLSSATGNILHDTLGFNYWVGVLGVILLSALVTFRGTVLIERFNGIGTILLIAGYVLFSLLVITTRWDEMVAVFAEQNHSLKPDATLLDALFMGMIYVGLGFVIYPSTLMSVRHLKSRKDSIGAGILTGGLYVVPWFLTFFALMSYYPSATVFDAPVPWLVMLQDAGGWIVVVYGLLVGWTLIATAVGLVQSIVLRVDTNLKESKEKRLSGAQKAGIVFGALIAGMILSQIGIVDLIAVGYLIGAVLLIVVFGIPLFIKGSKYLLPRAGRENKE
ncbi:YkvI family membrane protein [Leucobacter chinensis]|uniref:YkvI family membrane protein n=1 Tax=Leucobacter chinensis TaxID=2851010 RepID=UPI001C22CFAF|nr:hypothetical protein [Leucobacter chinensis]